jgi:hypothetical protein
MEKQRRVEKFIRNEESSEPRHHGRHDHRPGGPREFKRFRQDRENTVRLFTDKEAMVLYVNTLENIDNVDVYKIEDQLYKVLVTRVKPQVTQKESKEE